MHQLKKKKEKKTTYGCPSKSLRYKLKITDFIIMQLQTFNNLGFILTAVGK